MRSSPLRFLLPLAAAALLVSRPSSAQCTEEPCGLPDAIYPTVSISPASSSVAGPSLAVTISWSDNEALSQGSVQLTYGGDDVRAAFSYSKSNEWTATSSGSIAVRSGSHALVATICDLANNCTSSTVTYTGPQQAVAVTPDGGVVEVAHSSSASVPFTIRNTGVVATTFALSVECSWAGGCAPAASSITLQPDQAQDVDVSFGAPVNGPVTVRLVASAGSVQDEGSYAVHVVEPPSGDCQPFDGSSNPQAPICNFAPVVSISPGSADVSQPMIPVTVTGSDHYEYGDTTDLRVYVDNVEVTNTWARTSWNTEEGTIGAKWHGQLTGSVTLSETDPERTVKVAFCDAHQQNPECSEQTAVYRLALPGVEVTPNGLMVVVETAATRTRSFTVINRGTVDAAFALTPRCVDAESGGTLSPCLASVAEAYVSPGGSKVVTVEYPATQEGRILTVGLAAEQVGSPGVRDAGWASVTVRGGAGSATPPPLVALVDLNSTAAIERSECVTVAVSPGAAFECGDLRVAHGLPAHRTKGRTWAPVLLYNSAHADPRPTVYADVTLPVGAAVPATVEAVVTVGAVTHRRTFAGSGWHPGTSRRIAVQWFGTDMPSGVYPYALQVISHYENNPQASYVLSGELAVVNRSGSALGGGWWIAGDERLMCISCPNAGSRGMWEGGDGSTRILEPEVPGQWTKWTADRPDGPPDVVTYATVGGVGRYTRKLRGGGEILYDERGRQILTRNRLGEETVFERDSATGRLEAIHAPHPGTGPGPRWTFQYDAAGVVTSISAEGPGMPPRAVILGRGGANRLASITDPDGKQVRFDYLMTPEKRRMSSRYGRDSTRTRFEWNATGKLGKVQTYMQGTGADIVTGFLAGEAHGVAWRPDSVFSSVARMGTYTRIDGPRTDLVDHTYLWLGARGAPVRIVDAAGGETRIVRQDPHFSALATAVVGPSGLRSEVAYDARGRVDSMVVVNPLGDGLNAVTKYEWDDLWDKPKRVRSLSHDPAAGVSTPLVADATMGYDPVTGNTLWQQQGPDLARRTDFDYYPAGHAHAGQIWRVRHPQDDAGQRPEETLGYDGMGNLVQVVDPLGFVSLVDRDVLGRPEVSFSPIDPATAHLPDSVRANGMRVVTEYDEVERPWRTTSIGPAIVQRASPSAEFQPDATPEERLVVTTTFDGEGRPLTVTRALSPDRGSMPLVPQVTEFLYDRAGRKTIERSNGVEQRFEYDAAGNPLVWVTGRGLRVTSQFDALGRLTRRSTPSVSYANETCGGAPCYFSSFPIYPNASGSSYLIPEEWTFHRYDVAGQLVEAENAEAVVRRTYYSNGALKTDSLQVISNEPFASPEAYGIAYGYDRAGRLDALQHPENLAGTSSAETYEYDPLTGELSIARDRLGHAFGFKYDALGRRTGMSMPGAVYDSTTYDVGGRLTTRRTVGPGTTLPLQDERHFYDARGKVLRVNAGVTVGRGESQFSQWYSGLGNLVATDWTNMMSPEWQREEYQVDALGNVVHKRVLQPGPEQPGLAYPAFAYTLNPYRGYVAMVQRDASSIWDPRDEMMRRYDDSGNQVASRQEVKESTGSGLYTSLGSESRSYFDADERMRVFQQYESRWEQDESFGTAAGVWEEYRYDPLGRRIQVVTRRGPDICNVDASTCISSTTRFVWAGDQILWERKTADGSYAADASGLVSYFQAGGIDRPLVITKGGTSVVPHQNWRGSFARGTFASGTRAGQSSDCATYPPSNGCQPISWPGWATTAWHDDAGKQPTTGYAHYWFGSQAVGMRDASGQMYMRNRYYDPATGQFTQPDPIGLAGGLNSYGFAAGDPVSYSDPYGLNPCLAGPLAMRMCAAAITVTAFGAGRGAGQMINNATTGRPVMDGVGEATLRGATEGAALALGGEAAGALATRIGLGTVATSSAARSGGIRILEREGSTIVGSFSVANGEARFVGEMVKSGDDLILRGAHIEGDATLREVIRAAGEFGRSQGAKRVILHGGVRTTGANPGHVPRPITIETGL